MKTMMGSLRELAPQLRPIVADGRWALPQLAYRLSGGRVGDVHELYRAGVLAQRLRRHALPGMTADTERAYFQWHARDRFRGHGTIVDLGSWFGSTTACLAMGLVRNRRPAARREVIHAFDRFEWEWWMAPYARLAALGSYQDGDSFLDEFEHVVRPWRRRIEVHAGDLCTQSWTGQPIELLLVDAMKSWALAGSIIDTFYASVLPERGYVIHQDFGNCFTPWIHLTAYRLREYLEIDVDVRRSETVVFRLARPLPSVPEAIAERATYDDREIDAAFAHSLAITRPEKHSGINAARVMLYAYDGDTDRASAELERAERDQSLTPFHLDTVRRAIVEPAPGS